MCLLLRMCLFPPTSAVVVRSEPLVSDSDWEVVEPQSFSFSRKRRAVCVENQENMSCEGTRVKAPLPSSRKIMPPTPQQGSQSPIEAMQWQTEVEDKEGGSYEKEFEGEHRWTACHKRVIARTEQYLSKSDSMRVEIEELESLLGPEDSEEDLSQILRYASFLKRGRIFDIFRSQGRLAASRVRRDERQRLMGTQEEEARRRAQEVDRGVNQSWTAVFQSIAKKNVEVPGGQRSLESKHLRIEGISSVSK